MPRLNRPARIVLAGTVLLSSILAAQVVLMHRAVAQTLNPCSGKAYSAVTPTQACGEEVACGTPPCTQWFIPITTKRVFLSRCVGSGVPTSNCLTAQTTAPCGDGGPCLPNTKGGCSPGLGSTKFAQLGFDGGSCYIPN